jgi:hypothetical protein
VAIILKPENVAQLVFFIRGEKVMLDADLAKLYGVTTKALNQAMRRNKTRFQRTSLSASHAKSATTCGHRL